MQEQNRTRCMDYTNVGNPYAFFDAKQQKEDSCISLYDKPENAYNGIYVKIVFHLTCTQKPLVQEQEILLYI